MAIEPRARLGAFDIGCVVVGGIVGVGIFFTPQKVAERVDDVAQVVVAWSIGGLLAMVGAFVFADLSRRVPGHGGTYLYLRAAFGDRCAFLYGWANWLVIQSGALAVIGLIMVEYLDRVLWGSPRSTMAGKVVLAAAAIASFTVVNLFGLRVGKRVQNLLTVVKVLAVFALVVVAWLTVGSHAVEPIRPEAARRGWAAALAGAMLPVLFSFGGWQQGAFVAGAARRPRVDVPLGIVGGVSVVVVAYLTVNLAYLDVLGLEGASRSSAIAEDTARLALAPLGCGDLAGRLVSGMVVVSALGIMNTICLAPPFVLHEMARRGVFPRVVGELHARHGSPVVAVLVQGLWGVVLLLSAYVLTADSPTRTLGFLLDGVVFVDWVFFALCGLALHRLRRRDGPGLPGAAPAAAVFAAAAAAVATGAVWTAPVASGSGAALIVLGALVHAWSVRRRARSGRRS